MGVLVLQKVQQQILPMRIYYIKLEAYYLLLYFEAPTGIKLKHLEQLSLISKFPEIDNLYYRSCAHIFPNQMWVFK